MPGTQELTRRIKSVKSTRKITRAMQMVSASKMRKAQNATMASRTYSELAWELVRSLGGVMPDSDPASRFNGLDSGSQLRQGFVGQAEAGMTQGMTQMMRANPNASKIAIIIISTNRGLVGSFNANLLNNLRGMQKENPDSILDVITIGKKAAEGTARMHMNMMADFPKLEGKESVENVYPVAKKIADMYQSGEYKKVMVIYNHYVSTLVQKATVKQLLPFATGVMPGSDPASRTLDSGSSLANAKEAGMTQSAKYEFEPSPELVINHLVPRILESQLYQAILESNASEHSARMIMMKSATDAAGDLIDDLTLTFNQLRQNKITTELSEITAGKIALEK